MHNIRKCHCKTIRTWSPFLVHFKNSCSYLLFLLKKSRKPTCSLLHYRTQINTFASRTKKNILLIHTVIELCDLLSNQQGVTISPDSVFSTLMMLFLLSHFPMAYIRIAERSSPQSSGFMST